MYLTPFSEPPSSSSRATTAREPITDVTNTTARDNDNKTKNNTAASPFVPPKNGVERRRTRSDALKSTPNLNLISVPLLEEGIEDGLAAHLASSLVAHILWSRGQVPLPLPQLAKMQAYEEDDEELPTNSKEAKEKAKANALLESFDILGSHLSTTFTALSTAMALGAQNEQNPLHTAHMSVVLGSSLTSSGKTGSSTVLVIDGLVGRIWGQRRTPRTVEEDESDEERSEDEEGEEEGGDSEGDEDNEEQEVGEEQSEEPPDSDEEEEEDEDEEDEEEDEDSEVDENDTGYLEAQRQRHLQDTMRTADKLLLRALVGGSGGREIVVEEELAPTQAHILLRAPRRFKHDAWMPKQNLKLAPAVESLVSGGPAPSSKASKKDKKVDVVWIEGTGDVSEPPSTRHEDDEMIWWIWTGGKIVGFSM
ncbi:hypothetical protein CYLTODRAFT_446136 [Cylindrobasidium torrendii FP15055 ss-10]|uniref:Uncharacterized protein n=1 Tax=Cylindrobasidium torrendii FP15055 ss-10 TaxID=1314674 RepID=A0A0D7B171_9AGAR|nr:hypothetical protein CYLTODRAFT_446136 [Cylindrobasidium torrendii FP15055 ss-10]